MKITEQRPAFPHFIRRLRTDISRDVPLTARGWGNTEDGGRSMWMEEDPSEIYLQYSRIKFQNRLTQLCEEAANNKIIDNVDSFCASKQNDEAYFALVSIIYSNALKINIS